MIVSQIFRQILELIEHGEVRISVHGYDELIEDDIFVKDVMAGIREAVIIEDYPNYPKGPCVLVLEHDFHGRPILRGENNDEKAYFKAGA